MLPGTQLESLSLTKYRQTAVQIPDGTLSQQLVRISKRILMNSLNHELHFERTPNFVGTKVSTEET
jgi:hypothetical protein